MAIFHNSHRESKKIKAPPPAKSPTLQLVKDPGSELGQPAPPQPISVLKASRRLEGFPNCLNSNPFEEVNGIPSVGET
ncbi:hypothetical protein DdX_02839 [Ditylenchus destructor]|uniref:Uncharacterized protein n=1 Tax=Ditylenchus destructor TaxID=166010 RepID=A0AAD4NIA9_9BILA|nr:hypothetical protein DdX_02839 [Ditylenchus destructor]